MPTERSELSRKNKYWISKHRYLELKHFCQQYSEWLEEAAADDVDLHPSGIDYSKGSIGGSGIGDPTAAAAMNLADADSAQSKINLIRQTAAAADPALAEYILLNVTEGLPYWKLKQIHGIPCGKNYFTKRRQKFYWILDKKKK